MVSLEELTLQEAPMKYKLFIGCLLCLLLAAISACSDSDTTKIQNLESEIAKQGEKITVQQEQIASLRSLLEETGQKEIVEEVPPEVIVKEVPVEKVVIKVIV